MPWECGECNAKENKKIRVDAVCHHCGKPLCHEDQVLIADFVFASESGTIGREAVHCRPCRRQHHPTDVPLKRERR